MLRRLLLCKLVIRPKCATCEENLLGHILHLFGLCHIWYLRSASMFLVEYTAMTVGPADCVWLCMQLLRHDTQQ